VPTAWEQSVGKGLSREPSDRWTTPSEFVDSLRLGLSTSHIPHASAEWSAKPSWDFVRQRWQGLSRAGRAVFVVASVSAATFLLSLLDSPQPLLGFEQRDWILVADFLQGEQPPELARALSLALDVGLRQSRHVNVLPRSAIESVLRLMERPIATPVDEAVGREIGRRAGLKAVVIPELSSVGDLFVLTLRVIDPANGLTVASFEQRVASENELLNGLDDVLRELREGLGESLGAIEADHEPLPQVTTSSLDALRSYADGNAAWNAGRYRDALTFFEAALGLDPEFASAHAALANAYGSFIFLRLDTARYHFDQALSRLNRLSPREQYFIQALYQSTFGAPEEAIRYYQLHLDRYPDDLRVRYNLGVAFKDAQNCGLAVREYAEVLRVDPRDFGSLINTATCHVSEVRLDSALAYYSRAFEVRPELAVEGNLNHEFGMAYVQAGRLEEARAVFERRLAHVSASERGQAQRSLAQWETFQGYFRNAADRLSMAAALHLTAGEPGSAARDRHWHALLEIARGDQTAAANILDRAITEVPDDTGWLWLRARIGRAYVAAGKLAPARAILESLEARDLNQEREDDRVDRIFLQASLLTAAGDPERALELLEPELRPPARPTEVLAGELAKAYEAAGRWSDAAEMLRIIVEQQQIWYEGLVPWLLAHRRLGAIYERMGRTAEANEAYRRFIELWEGADPELLSLVDETREVVRARPSP
jgi:tetratricopeptide (TPR) repeat protein